MRCTVLCVGKGTKEIMRDFKKRMRKLMWYGIMKEFNCKATSTCSKYGREKETAFMDRQLGERRQEWKAQLDCIIGPRWRSDEAYIYNDVKMWDLWDQKLQSHGADIGDDRSGTKYLHDSSSGKGKKNPIVGRSYTWEGLTSK